MAKKLIDEYNERYENILDRYSNYNEEETEQLLEDAMNLLLDYKILTNLTLVK